MKRLSDVVGMPVVCAKSGKTIGDVKEPVFTPNGSEVAGLLTLIRGNVNKTGIIFIEDILDIGKDAILIFDNNSIEEDKKVIKGFMKNNKWFCMNKKVLTKDGIELGIIKDGSFDEKTGKISEFALSLGIFEDIRDGRKILQLSSDTEFGEDYILVPKGGKGYE